MKSFIGRALQLKQLSALTKKPTASFVVINGRRRIGKSRLVEEFGRDFTHFYRFSGLPPDQHTTAAHQLQEFSRQLSRAFNTANARYDDWSDALWAVAERVQQGKVLLLFDEISWMGSHDPTFLGKIKNVWDTQLKNNSKLIFVVCGSASSWIEKNILSSTGFVGRISLNMTLDALLLSECNQFWPKHISAYEKFKVLSITGGVPKYLEEILPGESAEHNIKRLCFTRGGFLTQEFEHIFSDIFLRQSHYYRQIVVALCDGAKEVSEIAATLNIKLHGRIREYLQELILAGFVVRDHAWHLKTGEDTSSSRYRLSDNYMRFYLRYIEKNQSKIQRNAFAMKSLHSLPQWSVMMGLQFENLVLNNRMAIHQQLGITPEDVVADNPFFQKKTNRQRGCQIDYMVQTRFDTLYVCEIKFSRHPVGVDVIAEVEEKIMRLTRPRGFSCRPVLIHVNGVTEALIDTQYFAHVIDFSQFLEAK